MIILEYIDSILAITGLMIVTLASPGPDFAIIVKNSIIYSRKTALFTALGIALGILIHVTYTLLGFGIIIAKTPWLFSIFKYLGAAYLIYIGFKGLRAKKSHIDFEGKKMTKDISTASAISAGFFTNALNPKAMLFFVSLFSALMSPDTSSVIMTIYAIIIFTTTLVWFSLVAFFLSGKKTRKYFSNFGYLIERITGIILCVLGVFMLFFKI